ncbi:tryptophan synthase beta subunit-like PLP-dependent enzyme [Penicillium paradoxum]|uniref:tryptophan synthase beta subunit-like PLP-dependent enzyme n=1 Tax=Penicillium paradoxum TaxID=176176 RepID=UPI0025486903|nr:tryptophan synthase beta subunit-like PLP-dependent enzyme [Penicillium paradoxum]KAJ5794945.1 tryptophan synthase beta subunit-like PLP-dependent enzyme [Penicillium paradoxum]
MGHYDSEPDCKKPWLETPLIESVALSEAAGCRIFLKIETLQPSGSFKSRGIGNLILSFVSDPSNHGKSLHFFSSSGGNAGLAAIVAARDLGFPCTVVVPLSTQPMMIEKLLAAGASDVIRHGATWFQADTYLRQTFIENQDTSDSSARNFYVPPFDHPVIWQGAATLIDEIVKQLPPKYNREIESSCSFPADAIVCSVGGGGLLNGIVEGIERHLPAFQKTTLSEKAAKKVRVLAVETAGADSLAYSLSKGSLQSLSAITSQATTLGALCVAPQAFKHAQSPPAGIEVTSVVGTDADAARGVVRLCDELRLEVELSCGISVQVGLDRLQEVMPDLTPESRVVIIVCGGSGITPEMITDYRQKLENGWK